LDNSASASPPTILTGWQGRKVTLIGLGRRTHVALAHFLVNQGAQVRVSEAKSAAELTLELNLIRDLPLDLRLGGHHVEDVADAEIVFVTPGAPRDLPVLLAARRRGIPISSEIELLFARCRAPIVGITGSAGKSTTTTLVGKMLAAAGRTVSVGGNIGVPLIEQVDAIQPDEWVVLELSSYQLEALHESAHVGAILNVTPNHLDRHPTFEHYRDSKLNLVRYQHPGDIAVLGADDPVASSLAAQCPAEIRWFSGRRPVERGAFLTGVDLVVRNEAGDSVFGRVDRLKLPGRHNVLNVLAAATISHAVGIEPATIGEVAASFGGIEHRLELVRELDGVRYYNDSIATSPERTVAALRSFERPVVLIAGGRSKHLPCDELAEAILEKTRAVVTMSELAEEIEDAVHRHDNGGGARIERADSLADAISRARRLANPGDAIVLSPAGTSFDWFRDFEDRGQQFKSIVAALAVEG
jgi:UDP-N-acetylmuramoylalanine--D-glutamate ligase